MWKCTKLGKLAGDVTKRKAKCGRCGLGMGESSFMLLTMTMGSE